MAERKIGADAVRGDGQLEAVSISTILVAGDASVPMFTKQLDKPLNNDEIELMLSNQAIVLNIIANRQIQLSADILQVTANRSDARVLSERYLKNGYKAFELSRKCLTALNEVRNPKRSATFIKQQNNQLNLNGDRDGETMDRISEGKTESFNPNVATLEALDRCENT
ncbi:hypothetical protein TUMEXPCC7403_25295 [Tumidithrix helvetica PCC 7403]|uniref:hypothetical protein n=1 Tax=Tumidithrix helvetica TaxID=3457545 RepID=UPI003CBB30E7